MRSRRQTRWMLALFVAQVLTALPFATVSAAPPQRFALLIAHNDGGPGTTPLRYSESDAKKLESVLRELGGYDDGNMIRILGGTANEVLGALDRLEARIRFAKMHDRARTMLLVYYSGHGKNGDLRLGQSQLPMSMLRQRLHDSSADLKLGIVDACESGAITREKGGRRGPSFIFDSDDRETGRGLILITSSSENEASQESDELGGSFFTHYLASGLRGDADESGDRRVTLGEVYAYTYHRTVSITASTRSGTQHPTYSYDFKGNGDIILTDLSNGTSGVQFGERLEGDFLIFDFAHDQVAAEIKKERGAERRLALPPGDYVVKKRLADHLRIARFNLADNRYYDVDETSMKRIEFEDDYAKGSVLRAELERSTGLRVSVRAAALYQTFLSKSARDELFPPILLVGMGIDFAPILGARLENELLLAGRNGQKLSLAGADIGYDFFEAQLGTSLLWGLRLGDFDLAAGPRLAAIYLRRAFPQDSVLARHVQDHFGLSPGIASSAAYNFGGDRDFSVQLAVRLGFLPFGVDENRALFFAEGGIFLGYRL